MNINIYRMVVSSLILTGTLFCRLLILTLVLQVTSQFTVDLVKFICRVGVYDTDYYLLLLLSSSSYSS